jgi:hypothetical protein
VESVVNGMVIVPAPWYEGLYYSIIYYIPSIPLIAC